MSLKTEASRVYLPDVVGRGYKDFWCFKGRYRAVKGSRRSKKSKTMALWTIYNLMKYPESNMLVVRKTYRTLKDSCFTELKWAIKRLKVEKQWTVKESPLEMTYIPTGQKIYFRGLDDPLKITSIAVEVGVLSWMWIEEAYEITKEEDFDTLAESMLGDCPPGLFKQITLTFNPWNEKTWLKKRFFDDPDEDTLAITTNYKCNEWLSETDISVFEKMRERNPRRYQVAGLGDWGIVDGLIYENWREQSFTLDGIKNCKSAFGLDFGYTNDPSAFFAGFVDLDNRLLYVWDEFYEKGMSNRDIYTTVVRCGYSKERIVADSAEPKSIDELKGMGLRISGARKGKDSVLNGIQWIQDFEIIIHPRCVNFITEISNYTWDTDKFGNKLNRPIDAFNHLMDAMRYALESYIKQRGWIS
nr:MAG TPA: terminase large subunit [Caudoviricetes sp.]